MLLYIHDEKSFIRKLVSFRAQNFCCVVDLRGWIFLEVLFDYSRLTIRICEKYGTPENFCSHLGMSRRSMRRKLTNKAEFTQAEIKRICYMLDISGDEVHLYFFMEKVKFT